MVFHKKCLILLIVAKFICFPAYGNSDTLVSNFLNVLDPRSFLIFLYSNVTNEVNTLPHQTIPYASFLTQDLTKNLQKLKELDSRTDGAPCMSANVLTGLQEPIHGFFIEKPKTIKNRIVVNVYLTSYNWDPFVQPYKIELIKEDSCLKISNIYYRSAYSLQDRIQECINSYHKR